MKRQSIAFLLCASILLCGCNSNSHSPKQGKTKSESSLSSSSSENKPNSSSGNSDATISSSQITSSTSSPTQNSFTITWLNWNGTVLEVDRNVPVNSFPSFDSVTPKREDEGQYSYIFDGWSPNLVTVTGDATYTAKYITSDRYLDVKWINYNGDLLDSSRVKYGEKPEYQGTTPKREDSSYIWTFTGWSPTVTNIYENTTYTAQFESSTRYECDNVYHWTIGGKKESHDYSYGAHQTFTCSVCGHTAKQPYTCSSKTDSTTQKKYFSDFSGYIEGTKDFIVPKIYGISETVYDARELRKYLSEVENLWLPSTLTNVDLSGLPNLKQVNFENTAITEMPRIWGDDSLKQITLPASLCEYEADIYSSIDDCSSLEAIYVDESNQNFVSIDGNLYSKDRTTLYRVPAAKTNCAIDSNTTTITPFAASYCTKLASVSFSDEITSIGKYAFYSCESLKEANIPDSVTAIGLFAFKDCTNLESATLPNNTHSWTPNGMFNGCNNIKTIHNVKTYLDEYFQNSIGVKSYDLMYQINDVVVPKSMKTISYCGTRVLPGVLSGTSASTIILSPNTTELVDYAFDHSANLTTLDFNGAQIANIPQYCFKECNSLIQFEVPDGVTAISQYSFQGCSKLENLTVPISVTTFYSFALDGCDSISDIFYQGTIQQWGQIVKSGSPSKHPIVHCSDGDITW